MIENSLQARKQKEQLRSLRDAFFSDIIEAVDLRPTDVDRLAGHDKYWAPSSATNLIKDPALGALNICVETVFHQKKVEYNYAINQVGTVLRIGLLLDGEAQIAPLVEGTFEIHKLWPGTEPLRLSREGQVLYEWTFEVPELYESWLMQERFILGMRHFHFRVLRILHDGLASADGELDFGSQSLGLVASGGQRG